MDTVFQCARTLCLQFELHAHHMFSLLLLHTLFVTTDTSIKTEHTHTHKHRTRVYVAEREATSVSQIVCLQLVGTKISNFRY